MSSSRRGACVFALVASALGCATPYKPPTAAQPHAVLKLRRNYQTVGGTHLREAVTIDKHTAFAAQDEAEAARAARADAILVHPTTAEVSVSSEFSHTEMRTVEESYTVEVPYTTTESYSCGTYQSPQTCSRSVTNYRSETRYRSVLKAVEVSDGACSTALWLSPAVNGAYLLEYEYAERSLCRLACFEQVPLGEPGTFQNRPCQPPSADAIRKARRAR